ncbi:MAG: LysM peptidoglycan-binding domain-containing protein [Bacteroidia bacterium]|nr:LysM peptidoglycan-binding domain-containing protein [Bacteroidia bacterium]
MKVRKFTIVVLLTLIVADFANAGNRVTNESKTIHRVEQGETIYAISRKYDVSVEALMISNSSISDDYVILTGEVINIPDQSTVERVKLMKVNCQMVKCRYHIVQSGETLESIAGKYNISDSRDIQEWNSLKNQNLYVGQEIIVKILETRSIPVKDASKLVKN